MVEGMAQLSEDGLIDTIRTLLSGTFPGVVVGPGDDAALVEQGSGLAVLTTDLMVEGVHFDPVMVAPRDLGYKGLVVNVSDVAAMGGSPRYALVSLGLHPDVAPAWVVELFGGMREAADEHAVALVGGDLSRSERTVVSVAVSGEVAKHHAVTRSGARPGDRIVVTGTLGAAAGGLCLAMDGSKAAHDLLAEPWARGLLAAQARPVARVGEGQTLAQAGATAMMDVSDGLAKDLGRLCRASDVGAAVILGSVPVAQALRQLASALSSVDPLRLALTGGDDYELLATLPHEAVERTAAKLMERFGTALTEVGEIREGRGLVAVRDDGSERPLEPEGWDHFDG
jgi:thiamine-monophosphate kinase